MNLCKPLEPLRLTGNNPKNWSEFKEQLQWFLAGTESSDKPDTAKLVSCCRTQEKKQGKYTRLLLGPLKETKTSLIKF